MIILGTRVLCSVERPVAAAMGAVVDQMVERWGVRAQRVAAGAAGVIAAGAEVCDFRRRRRARFEFPFREKRRSW